MAHGVQPALVGSGIAGVGRPFTAELWDGYDPQAFLRNPGLGNHFEEDFLTPPEFAAASAAGTDYGFYNALTVGAAGTILGAGLQGGGCLLDGPAVDNSENYLMFGQTAQRSFVLASAAEDDTWPYHHPARVRFESRWALSTVGDNLNAIFVGFWGQALAAGALVDDTGELVSTAHAVGFQTIHGTGTNAILKPVYQENGSTRQNPGTTVTIVANQWVMTGLDFNPGADTSAWCKFYINGTVVATLTKAQCTASTFPISTDSVQIFSSPAWLRKSGAATSADMYLGGWRVCQEFMVSQGNEACG